MFPTIYVMSFTLLLWELASKSKALDGFGFSLLSVDSW